MIKYHKIDTVFNRDMEGTKKLIPNSYRNPLVEYLKDSKWIFTEKIDGCNIRVFWNGFNIEIAGRTEDSQMPVEIKAKLEEIFFNNETHQLIEQCFGENQVYLFGEGYGKKIQTGGNYLGHQDFILFDVSVNGIFLSRESVEEIAKTFSLKVVPIVLEGTIEQGIEFVKSRPNSAIAIKDYPMEGIIGTPAQRILDHRGHRVIVKIKYEDFKNL